MVCVVISVNIYNNTLNVVAKGGRKVEGGKSLVETTGSLTQTGVLPVQLVFGWLAAIRNPRDFNLFDHSIELTHSPNLICTANATYNRSASVQLSNMSR